MEAKRKKSGKSPTARSLEELRKRGCLAQVVEHWNSFTRTRKDLFGVIDVVALDVATGKTIGVQATASAVSARINKALSEEHEPAVRAWLTCNNALEFHGWRKNAKGRWVQRIVHMRLDYTGIITEEETNGEA